MSKKIDLCSEFEAAIGNFKPTREGRYDFRIMTKLGALDVSFYDQDSPWIAAIWDNVALVEKHFGIGDRLNPCSGKWNWHWFQFWPHKVKSRKSDRVEAGRKMIAAFVEKVGDLT